jgi:hypothetical protein
MMLSRGTIVDRGGSCGYVCVSTCGADAVARVEAPAWARALHLYCMAKA